MYHNNLEKLPSPVGTITNTVVSGWRILSSNLLSFQTSECKMSRIDPKVFFSNERTYLKWLHTSVTLGSIASGLLGLSSMQIDENSSGMKTLRVAALTLLLIAIAFCGYAIVTYQKRNRLLKMKSGEGYDDFRAPFTLGGTVVVLLSVIYGVYLVNNTPIHL